MASISKDKKTIQFVGKDGKRRSIRLRKLQLTAKAGESLKAKVEALNSSAITGHSWDRELSVWVSELDGPLYEKLAAVGLVPKREHAKRQKLGPYLDSYVKSRSDVKGSTATVYGHTRRCLVEFFGVHKPLDDITAADADDWRRWLATDQNLAENTIRRRCGIARQFFRTAMRRKLLSENPFVDMKNVTVQSNRSRDYFVTREEAAKVLEACPDAEWRLIFALSRYGGLRCPSETLALRVSDIDWDRGRMRIRSPKTEHHSGKDHRLVPIFSELRPYLEEVWFAVEPGTEFLINRYRDSNVNLRSRLLDIIWAAGLKEWPKLFQNLRASRETELVKRWPAHIAAEWMGHSQLIAAKHYLQVRDEDFAEACRPSDEALHQAVQSGAGKSRKASSPSNAALAITGNDEGLRYYTYEQVGDAGLEPATSTL